MNNDIDIRKAGGVLIKDRRFLVTRSRGKDMFVAPGGKLEAGETAESALVRELNEELTISVVASDLEILGTFYAQAAGNEDKRLEMKVFIVKQWQGEPTPSSEIDEISWIDSNFNDMQLGSIFEHDVLPLLKQKNLID